METQIRLSNSKGSSSIEKIRMNPVENQKTNASRVVNKRLTQEQVRLLEASFDATKKLDLERKFQLSRELGVPPRQIAIWYQNKRARWKNQTLELDHGAVQVRLEAALADKERLEKEVDVLRGELKLAREMLVVDYGQARVDDRAQPHQLLAFGGVQHPASDLSSCGDDGAASSSLNDDVGCSGNWGSGEELRFEELYACLMVPRESFVNCGLKW